MNPKQILERAVRRSSRSDVLNQLTVWGKKNPIYSKKVQAFKKFLRSSSFGSSLDSLDMKWALESLESKPKIQKPPPAQRSETDELTDIWRSRENPYIQYALKQRHPAQDITEENHNNYWQKKYTAWRELNPYPIEWPWRKWWEPNKQIQRDHIMERINEISKNEKEVEEAEKAITGAI